MKILYVASQRSSAEQAAHALHTIAPNFKLIWAQTPSSALRWAQAHDDLSAFWVDAQVVGQGAGALAEDVRALGRLKGAPVIVVVPEDLNAPLAVVKALASEHATQQRLKAADQEAQQQIALLVQHTEQRAAKVAAAAHTRLQELEAALRQAEQQRSSEEAASVERLAQRHAEFTASLSQAARSRDALAQQLSAATTALDEVRLARAADAAAHSEHRARQDADFAERLRQITSERDTTAAESLAVRQTLEHTLAEAEAAGRQAEERATADAASAFQRLTDISERLAARESELGDALAQATASRIAAEQQIERLGTALREADARRDADAAAHAEQRARQESDFASRLDRMTRERDAIAAESVAAKHRLEHTLAEAHTAFRQVDERAAVDAAASLQRQTDLSERLAQRDAELGAALAQAAAARAAAEQQIEQLGAALREANARREADAAAHAEQGARQEADFISRLTHISHERDTIAAESVAARTALEHTLAEAHTAFREADTRAAADATAALRRQTDLSERLARREAELGDALAQAAAARLAAEQQIEALGAALRQAEMDRVAHAAAHAEEQAAQHAEFTARLNRVISERDTIAEESLAARNALEHTLADSEAAYREAEQRAAADAAAALHRQTDLGQRLARREAELGDALAQAASARAAAEQQIEQLGAARREANARREADTTAHAEQRAQQDAEFTARYTQVTSERDTSARQLSETTTALEDARRAMAADAAQIADLQKRHSEAIARMGAVRDAFELQLIDTAATLERAREEHTAEAVAAAERLRLIEQQAANDRQAARDRETALEQRLSQETAALAGVTLDLAANRSAAARSRRRLLAVASEVRRIGREHKVRLEGELAQERVDRQRIVQARDEEIREVGLDRDAFQQSLHAAREELQRLGDRLADERQESERLRSTSEAELQRLTAEHDQARHSLTQVRAAFQTLELVSSENAAERARLESVVAERDAHASALAANHLAAEHTWKQTLGRVEETLRSTLDANTRDVAARDQQLNALRQELELLKTHNEVLRGDADRVPVLQRQLDEIQQENRRQFHRSPFAMCRCTRDGVITHVNRSLVDLLGYRTADEFRKVNFAADVFEAAADLKWSIERSASTGALESLETTWKKADRSRLIIRLHVMAAGDESVEIVAEDITRVRTVEARLRQAERMEAVGRLASEVAVTCDNLLSDVSQGGQEWIAGLGSDPALRHQGEQLLGEVTRAASFLRQFATYGNKQMSALEPVDVQKVLRDLAPVLTRVAGDDIELELPQSTAPIDVDVDRERVERVLVNVASYARQRMPLGGRVKIDLGSTVVDRGFVAKYPNVRPGAHVLITVSEIRSEASADSPLALVSEPSDTTASGTAAEKPGVDLSALLQLIRNCGGHLWVTAEPSGNMTLKIRLPKRAPDGPLEPAAAAGGSNRGRTLTKWFRH